MIDEIPSYLAESRRLVLPSESEGVSKTTLEAMACGTVPVATPVGSVPDVVTDDETGVLLADNAPETIARTLNQVLNRDDLDEMATRGRKYIRDTHSFSATAERFQTILTSKDSYDANHYIIYNSVYYFQVFGMVIFIMQRIWSAIDSI